MARQEDHCAERCNAEGADLQPFACCCALGGLCAVLQPINSQQSSFGSRAKTFITNCAGETHVAGLNEIVGAIGSSSYADMLSGSMKRTWLTSTSHFCRGKCCILEVLHSDHFTLWGCFKSGQAR